MGGGTRRERAVTGPHLVDFRDGVARSEFGHDEGDGEVLKLEGKEKKFRVAKKQVSPLDVHHPRSAMASPSSQNPSRTSPSSPPGPHAAL